MSEFAPGRLRLFNLAAGLLHAAQGALVLALANDFSLPVTGTFMEGPPGADPAEPVVLLDVPFAWGVALFLFMSAAAHWLIASPWIYPWYLRGLSRQHNDARWVEYSFSASLMIVLIALLTGVSDGAALLAIAGVNASMILFGWLQERYEQPGVGGLLPFWFGSLAGAVPWLAVGLYLWSPGVAATPPGFVVAIYVSLFLFFNVFAVNMLLQYRRVGPWRDYLFGERIYIVLSLTAKSALAWQVFAGTLAPS
ncbi:MAG: heliorhodopsin HeR [Dehalococcoidia bacterium]